MDNKWTDSLRDRMTDYEETAPEGLWESIAESSDVVRSAMQGSDARKVTAGAGNRRRIVFWPWMAAGIAAAVAMFLVPGHDSATPSSFSPAVDILADAPSVIVPSRYYVAPLAGLPERAERPSGADSPAVIPAEDPESRHAEQSGMANDEMPDHVRHDQETGQAGNDRNVRNEQENSGVHEEKEEQKYPDKDVLLAYNEADDDRADKPARRWSAGLLASNLPVSSSTSRPGYEVIGSPKPAGINALGDIRTYNTTRQTNTSSQHFQPVRVGVTVAYRLTGRWSVESGLTYTYLFSKFRSGSDDYYETGAQSLHYIGLPLNVNFNIWDNRYLTVYASAGGLMEKCVGGSLRTTPYFAGAKPKPKDEPAPEKVMVKPLQWSVSASVGLQYNISYLMGLYLKPGVAYYFDNGSPVQTAYSARPLNFNLELGLKFSF